MEEKETTKLGNNRIIFFLGAGASVPADVPQIVDFTKKFEENIKKKRDILGKIKKKYGEINVESLLKAVYSTNSDNENAFDSSELKLLKKELEQFVHEKIGLNGGTSARVGDSITKELINEFVGTIRKNAEALEEIQKILREKRKIVDVDVELLLEALHELNDRGKYVLPDISELNEKLKGRESELESLEKELRRFIREKTIVSEDKIGYLAPLKEFVDEYKTLDVFSVNYDTCIEQFCKKHNFNCTDGFELYWNPNSFKNDYKIKLYKIHGSVTWYKTDEGDYIKVPIASEKGDEIELIMGEKAKTLMVYPMPGKFEEYSTPQSEIIHILHKKLEEVKVCIVIGYRFRDDEIRTIFFEAAKKASQKNEGLILFLIAPDAGKIYDDKLKFIDKDKRKPSSLEGRVICWNYPMENVLKDNCLYRSLGKLSAIQKGLEKAHEFKRERGSKVGAFESRMQKVVSNCIEIRYTSMAEKVLKELGITNLKEESLFARNDRLKLHYSLGVYHLLSSDYKDAKKYFEDLRKYFGHAVEVGNKYFELHRQFSRSKEDIKRHKEIGREIDEIVRIERNSYYVWMIEDWGTSDCIGFLSQQKELRSKGDDIDDIDDIFSEIMEICDDMKKCFNILFNADKYKDCEQISCGKPVEIDRKTDLERNMNELLDAFDKLIDFCESQEVEQIID